MSNNTVEPIAIIGMSCRFPGAASITEFWSSLREGRNGIGAVPAQRWDADALYNADSKTPGKINTRTGGFIADVDRFDAAFFGISPREATQMDPQQRILLELAYEALEDAGVAPASLSGSDTSVYVGAMTNEYMRHQTADAYQRIDVHTGAGAGLCMLANRLSYQFDLRGPSAAVDSACSSSLVAVFHACQSLWTGQSRLAIAAGVNVILDPAFNVFYAKAGLSAPDGKCKTFSAEADGIGRAEGAGIVVLKPLQQALADGDPVYAVIRGGAINHDGRSNGLTQPNRWAQEQLLRIALEQSATERNELGYIELHGTGTLIGDPIEANALSAVLTEGSKPSTSCLVGSVKSNIGHLEAAAGIAGLIKLALSVHHGEVPPSLWFDAPNPHIAFDRMPIRVNTSLVPWPEAKGKRIGGISSFGLGGTNAHLVVESAPVRRSEFHSSLQNSAGDQWLFLSARSDAALRVLAGQYVEFLSAATENDLPAVCSTALRRKGIHDFRLSVLGNSKTSIIQSLHAFSASIDDNAIVAGRFRPSPRSLTVALPETMRIDLKRLSQWIATAPIARQSWNECRASFARYSDVILPPAETLASLADILDDDVNFPAWHFALQYAMLKQVLEAVPGVETLVADGLGQLAAMCATDVVSLDIAVRWLGTGLSEEFVQYESLSTACYTVNCDFVSGTNPSPARLDWGTPARSWRERFSSATDGADHDLLVLNLCKIADLDSASLVAIDATPLNDFHRVFAQLALRRTLEWRSCANEYEFVRLPSYPWQRESFWLARAAIEPIAPVLSSGSESGNGKVFNESPNGREHGEWVHALLGQRADSPMPAWEGRLDTKQLPYLPDHRVQGLMVLPGSAYAELGLAVHHEISEQPFGVLEDMEFHKALVIDEDPEPNLRVTYDESTRAYAVYSQRRQGKRWNLHARGRLSLVAPIVADKVDIDAIKNRCTNLIEGEAHYQNTRDRGFGYGPYFQGVRRLWIDGSGEHVLAWIEGHERLAGENHRNRLHPTVFDASLQILLASLSAKGDTELYIPVGIRRLTSHRVAPNGFWCYGKLKQNAGVAEGDVILFDEEGNVIADARGVRASALTKKTRNDELKQVDQWLYQFSWEQSAPATAPTNVGRWLVFMDKQGHGDYIARQLTAMGADTVIQISPATTFEQLSPTKYLIAPQSKTDIQRTVKLAQEAGVTGFVYLWGLDIPDADELVPATSHVLPATHLIQSVAQAYGGSPARVVVVTRNAQSIRPEEATRAIAMGPLIGLTRVAVNEYPEMTLKTIDIDDHNETLTPLILEIVTENSGDELALRNGERYTHRLLRKPVTDLDTDPQRRQDVLDSAVQTVYPARREPDENEVEVTVRQAALSAGTSAADVGGGYGSIGVVTRAGKNVRHVSPGNVVFTYRHGKINPHLTVAGTNVLALSRPDASTASANAACLPVFVNAHYALQHAARLQLRETLLVHNATSPIGLAAIQIARRLGASVFATVATDAQRVYLNSIGIDRVFDESALDFYDHIHERTNGRGVDVILNTLSGEHAAKSFGLLSDFGRFVDLSGEAAAHISTQAIRGNRSLITVDAAQFMAAKPGLFAKTLIEVCRGFRKKDLVAIPSRTFEENELALAAQAANAVDRIGAVAVSFSADSGATPIGNFYSDATYLITGGFGGFGLKIAAWMIEQGARNLVLVGRRGAQSPEAKLALERLNKNGVRVVGLAADVSLEVDVKRIVDTIADGLPALKGVFHTAAVLDDSPINQIEPAQIENAMGAKSLGAWYLHRHTRHLKLDHFVLFSSIAAMVGGPGQVSYAMACIYLDALARYRRAQGLAATSINWGALAEVGMASRYADVEKYLSGSGVGLFTPSQAVALFGRVLRWNPVELGVATMDWKRWGGIYPGWAASPKYAALVVHEESAADQTVEPGLLQTLSSLEPAAREQWIGDMLVEQLVKTLELAPEKIDRELSLLSMGIDSLTAMDLQAAVEKRIAVKISMLELMKGNSVVQLAQHIALTLGAPQSSDTAVPSVDVAPRAPLDLDDPQRLMAMLGELTDDEVDGLIAKLMPQGEMEQ